MRGVRGISAEGFDRASRAARARLSLAWVDVSRALRFLWMLAATISLMLCLAVAFLWHRSYATADFVGRGSPARWYGALSMSGLIRLERGDYAGSIEGWSRASYRTPDGLGLPGEVAARGTRRYGPIAYRQIWYDGTRPRWSVYVPHWFVVALVGALPTAHVAGRLLRRRRRPGHCATCGYDMRATPRRCPECGTTGA